MSFIPLLPKKADLEKITVFRYGKPYQTLGHGDTKPTSAFFRLYNIWKGVKRRCRQNKNPGDKYYQYYNHVSLCPEWNEYVPFKLWALANGYTNKLTIDRIDGNKGYCPENCRWATRRVQNQNLRMTEKRRNQIFAMSVKRRKPVICLDSGQKFVSVHEAARNYGCRVSHIIRAIKKNGRSGGVKWNYCI